MMGINFFWKSVFGQITYIIQKGNISNDKPLLLIIPGIRGKIVWVLFVKYAFYRLTWLIGDSYSNVTALAINLIYEQNYINCCVKAQVLFALHIHLLAYCFNALGNPGVADFYLEFMECLAKESKNTLPIVCISHAGHVTPPKTVTCCGQLHCYYG